MRNALHQSIKEYLCEQIKAVRLENKWSKKAMAEKLYMDTRPYSNLEKGTYACGTVTLVSFLFAVLPENKRLITLDELQKLISKVLSGAA